MLVKVIVVVFFRNIFVWVWNNKNHWSWTKLSPCLFDWLCYRHNGIDKMLTCGSPIFSKSYREPICALYLTVSKSTRCKKECWLVCSSKSETSHELFSSGNQSLKQQRGCNTKWMLANLKSTWCFQINAVHRGWVLLLTQTKQSH